MQDPDDDPIGGMRVLVYMLIGAFLTVVCLVSAAWGNPMNSGGGCSSPANHDRYELRPDPENVGSYIFKYWNSQANCSDELNDVGISYQGFKIRLHVKVDYEDDAEYIYVVPESSQYMAYPPELILKDGDEPGTIRLFPGIS